MGQWSTDVLGNDTSLEFAMLVLNTCGIGPPEATNCAATSTDNTGGTKVLTFKFGEINRACQQYSYADTHPKSTMRTWLALTT